MQENYYKLNIVVTKMMIYMTGGSIRAKSAAGK
jgi:hypothetical protein